MDLTILALAASMSLGQVYVGGTCNDGDCLLATPRQYPLNMVDSVRRPGFNGRLYMRRPIIGGLTTYARPHDEPGPEAYGAYGAGDAIVWARVGHLTVALDPFVRLRPQMHHLERARQLWLRRNGFVGGVRTHVNDLYLYDVLDDGEDDMPSPRATIRVPSHWRRSPTLEVRGVRPPVVSMDELASAPREYDMRSVVSISELRAVAGAPDGLDAEPQPDRHASAK